MKITIIKPGVTDGRSVHEVGSTVDFPDTVAKNLIKNGYAAEIEQKTTVKEAVADGDTKPVAKKPKK